MRLDEVCALVKFMATGGKSGGMENKIEITNENVRFCDEMLGKVSRSFSAVIR